MTKRIMTDKEFDEYFDNSGDITPYIVPGSLRQPGLEEGTVAKRTMTAEEFDEYFDNGGDTTPYIVPGSLRQPGLEETQRRVNLNLPGWLVDALDREARHLAIPRQSVVITWLAERAKQEGLA